MEDDKKNKIDDVVVPDDFKFQEDNQVEQSFSDVVPKDPIDLNLKDEKEEAKEIAQEEAENEDDDDDEEEVPVKKVPQTKEEKEVAENKTIHLSLYLLWH